mgnify:CR=1 FL=1
MFTKKLGANSDQTENQKKLILMLSFIHLFQKSLSERTVNGSSLTEIARSKGTLFSISTSCSRGAKLILERVSFAFTTNGKRQAAAYRKSKKIILF